MARPIAFFALVVWVIWMAVRVLGSAPGNTSAAIDHSAPVTMVSADMDPEAVAALSEEAQEHVDAAVEYRDEGKLGLALVEIGQAIAILGDYEPALRLQQSVVASATTEVQNARAEMTAVVLAQQASATAQARQAAEGTATARAENARLAAQATSDAVNAPKLELGKGWTWHTEYSYLIAEGTVKNLSNESLKNVMAVVNFMTADDTFVKSTDALISYNPILPGQTSPWRASTTGNPAIKFARVEFKMLLGGTIRTRQQ